MSFFPANSRQVYFLAVPPDIPASAPRIAAPRVTDVRVAVGLDITAADVGSLDRSHRFAGGAFLLGEHLGGPLGRELVLFKLIIGNIIKGDILSIRFADYCHNFSLSPLLGDCVFR